MNLEGPRPSLKERLSAAAIFLLIATVIFRVIFLYAGGGASPALSQRDAPLWPKADTLTLILLDGVPEEVLTSPEHYPKIAALIREKWPVGSHRVPEGFTTTGPIVLAMGTGAPSPPTQLLDNFSSKAVKGDSLFRSLKRQGRTSEVIGEKIWADLFGPYIDHAYVHEDHGLSDLGEADREAFESALHHGGETDLTVIHFTSSDHAGHRFNFEDAEYREVSRTLDGYVAALLDRFPERHFLITADHGMSRDRSHVRDERSVTSPPLVCVGPRCPRDAGLSLDTVGLATLVSAFLGVGPPASATALPPRGAPLAFNAGETDAYIKAFYEDVITKRRGALASLSPPTSWEDLDALNKTTLKESRRHPPRTHITALALVLAGLIGVALYRPRPDRAWIALVPLAGSWLADGGLSAALVIGAALTLAAAEWNALLLRDRLLRLLPAYAAVGLVCLPATQIEGKLSLASAARSGPSVVIAGLLAVALVVSLRRRANLWTVGALCALWSMLFMAHRYPQGAATYAVTALSVGAAARLALQSGLERRAALGAALTALAWAPFYLAGGAPSALNGAGSGLHLAPESAPLRILAAALFASFLLWLYRELPTRRMGVIALACAAAPLVALTPNGLTIEVIVISFYVALLVGAGARQARIAAAVAGLALVCSSAQLVAMVLMAWGYVLLGPSLARDGERAGELTAGALLASCLYILGMTFHVGRLETALTNPDLVAPRAFWVEATVALIMLKVILALSTLLLNWAPHRCLERVLLNLALLSVVPLIALHNRGYPGQTLAVTPVLVLFAAAALLGRHLVTLRRGDVPLRV